MTLTVNVSTLAHFFFLSLSAFHASLSAGIFRFRDLLYTFSVSVAYSLPEVIFLKNPALILNESHILSFKADDKIICRTVNAWLTKELQKCKN